MLTLFSQKTDDPGKVSINDFAVPGTKSVYLYYRALLTFPYSLDDKMSGARDKFFSLKNETYMRILLNKRDTNFNFFITREYANTEPDMKSITCYSINKKKVSTRKIKESGNNFLTKVDPNYFMDLSSFRNNDDNVIIDIAYSFTINSKKEINFYMDRTRDYKLVIIKADIPEIYTYQTSYDEKCLTKEISEPHDGPPIGYLPPSGIILQNSRFITKSAVESFNRPDISPDGKAISHPPVNIVPFNCMINTHVLKSKEYINAADDINIERFSTILTLSLLKIEEIYR